jgi:hypothetical protein
MSLPELFSYGYLPCSTGRPLMTNSKTSEPVETCWRVIEGSSTRMLTCAIVAASTQGVELRLGYFVDVPLHSQMMPDIESARVLAQEWLEAVRAASKDRLRLAMRFHCLACTHLIDGDPWWYDSISHGVNRHAEGIQITRAVSQRPNPPTPVSAPFHKACLEKQMGLSVDS